MLRSPRTLIDFSLNNSQGIKPILSDNAKLLTNSGEGLNSAVYLLIGVSGGELGADASLSLGHHRVTETNNVDIVIHKFVRYVGCKLGIAEHHGSDGAKVVT